MENSDKTRKERQLVVSRRAVMLGGAAFASGVFGLMPQVRAAGGPPSKPTGQAVIGFSQEITVMHPLMAANEVDQGMWWSLYDTLWVIDDSGEFVPILAKQVPSAENGGVSPDGLNWRIELRDDVKWHDGKKLTAQDVKYSLETIQNPAFRARSRNGFELVTDIQTEGDNVVTWKMKEPFAPFVSMLSWMFIVPSHILSKFEDPNAPEFANNPVGTGAFKFVERQTGNFVKLEANPDYFGDGPYLEGLVFKYVPDLNAMYTLFKTGEIDYMGVQGISSNFYQEAKQLKDRSVYLASRSGVENLTLNLKHPVLSDKAVRQALYLAIDQEAICDVIYYGTPQPANTFLPKANWAYNKNLPPHEFNLEKAAKILDEAGWKPGPDGIRMKGDLRLSFTNSTTTGNHLRAQTQQFLADTFKKIGVEMKIKNMVAAVLWADFWKLSQFESLMSGTTYTIASDPDVSHRFGSGYIPAETGSGANVLQYKNKEVDGLLAAARKEASIAKRKEMYHRVQELIRDDLPFLPLFSRPLINGSNAKLKGYASNVNVLANTWNAKSWYWSS